MHSRHEGGAGPPTHTVKWGGNNGGEELELVADGRIAGFMERVLYRRDHDDDYRAGYNHGEYIHNLLLDTLHNAGATIVLRKLRLPLAYACPHALYAFMCRMAVVAAASSGGPPPSPPATSRISCVADRGIFDDLVRHMPLMIAVEQWYADAYEWIVANVERPPPSATAAIMLQHDDETTHSEDEDWGISDK